MKQYSFNQSEAFMTPVLDSGVAKVVHLSLPVGKILDRHKSPSAILLLVFKGEIKFSTAEETVLLDQGDMVSLEKNVEHALEALSDSVVALVLTPSPSAVMAKSKKVQWIEHPVIPPEVAISPQLLSFVKEHADMLLTLDRAQNVADRAVYVEAKNVIGEELNHHFRYEEEILFPLLGKYIGTTIGPIAVMLAEHKIIRDNYDQLNKALSESCADDVKHAFDTVADLLRTHIMKEDHVLFPMASQTMSEEDKDEIARRVAAACRF